MALAVFPRRPVANLVKKAKIYLLFSLPSRYSTKTMNMRILASLLGIFLCHGFGHAALILQTSSQNVNSSSGVNFVFNQFNPALGSLNGVDVIVNSSFAAGSTNVINNSPTDSVTVRFIRSEVDVYDDPSLGFGGYAGPTVNLHTSPTAMHPTSFVLLPLSQQTFTVNAGQSVLLQTEMEKPEGSATEWAPLWSPTCKHPAATTPRNKK
jgi:hypothetical protein